MMEENKKYVLDGFEYETKEDYAILAERLIVSV